MPEFFLGLCCGSWVGGPSPCPDFKGHFFPPPTRSLPREGLGGGITFLVQYLPLVESQSLECGLGVWRRAQDTDVP